MRVEAREKYQGKVRYIVGLSATMNKVGRPTYLSNDKESLIVSYHDIEGGSGLPLDINSPSEQLQLVTKAVKFLCVNNDILNNVTPQVFTPSRQAGQ